METYDIKCWALANHFIDDHPHLRARAGELAIAIQDTIDDWISDQEQIKRIDDQLREITAE